MSSKAQAETALHTPGSFVPFQLGALADDIVSHHHSFVRKQGERILPLLEKVCLVQEQKEPRLIGIKAVFERLHQELLIHMLKEEQVLFPFCKELEATKTRVNLHCGSVAHPIGVMQYEHDLTSEQIKELQALSDHFTPPHWACKKMQALYQALKDYATDLETHMHLENNLLFPAALRREAELLGEQEGITPPPLLSTPARKPY